MHGTAEAGLTDVEVTVIGRPRTFAADLRDLLRHRDLLWLLALRDIKLRYRQTALGALWALLQPLLPMILFTAIFGRLAHLPSEGLPYAVFALAALVPWMFVANAVATASESLVGSAQVITKVYFPRLVVPAAAVLSSVLDFALGLVLLLVALAAWRVPVQWPRLLLVMPFAVLAVMLALAVGMGLAALNVRYRDVRHALPFAMQVWMYGSPVVFAASLVPQRWRWLLELNPMTGIIEGLRSAITGNAMPREEIAASAALTGVAFALAMHYFRSTERTFADVV
jgi:lipopolysaccharide transport system permease protein